MDAEGLIRPNFWCYLFRYTPDTERFIVGSNRNFININDSIKLSLQKKEYTYKFKIIELTLVQIYLKLGVLLMKAMIIVHLVH